MLNISAARRNRRQGLELNIAPLIDMVFILLIFFLVTTSFVREVGVDVDRPTAATAMVQQENSILVGVTADDRIVMESRQLESLSAARTALERALAENPEGSVIIVADTQSRTGTAIALMDQARLAGAQKVAVAAKKP